ncbi:cell division protein ZapA [Arachidicoccus terrestris]|uniref:cell division protein ZapA n=1 Tax=Arachidicoccus terrestris TaxID=2875539 RepID=UPI001CC336C7|nr:cell division protein ZapA [Arachidicoccus terrestris]UAY57174.1 cell division protein ZapA [Arachidicoccus terrestris]
MTDIIIINVLIGDRTFRLKTKKADEEIVRKTVKMVNDKVMEYKSKFAGKDMQDYVSMALLWLATEQNKAGEFLIEMQQTEEKLQSLQTKLDRLLQEDETEDPQDDPHKW